MGRVLVEEEYFHIVVDPMSVEAVAGVVGGIHSVEAARTPVLVDSSSDTLVEVDRHAPHTPVGNTCQHCPGQGPAVIAIVVAVKVLFFQHSRQEDHIEMRLR